MMQMTLFHKYFILLSLITVILYPAKAANNPKPPYQAIFNVTVTDTLIDTGSIHLEINNSGFNSQFVGQGTAYPLSVAPGNNFTAVSLTRPLTYGILTYRSIKNGVPKMFLYIVLVESDDQINITVNTDTIIFIGKGSDKYNCIVEQERVKEDGIYEESSKLPEKMVFERFMLTKNAYDTIFQTRRDIIEKYKSTLNPEVYNLMLADNQGLHNIRLLSIITFAGTGGKRRSFDDAIKKAYYQFFNNPVPNLPEQVLVQSSLYCDFLYQKEVFAIYFFNSAKPGYYNSGYKFKVIYDRIQKNYSGIIQDKLTLMAFYRCTKLKQDVSLFYDVALQDMQDSTFKAALAKLRTALTGKAYPFELTDDKGKIVRLSDFKGKLVVMDFWFTGCEACIFLAKNMKSIVASYKSNPKVVFVTVSIDKKRDGWLKSLDSELYSNKDEINLYTNGLGSYHPLIQHYKISAYPCLLLISKDGEIITTEPPRPTKQENIEPFKQLIDANI